MVSLETTRPSPDNPNIDFPEHYRAGRIVIAKGIRMLDWEDGRWVPYKKDGAQWCEQEFTEEDYEALRVALEAQL